MNNQEMIDVIQAHKEGKCIEWRRRDMNDEWTLADPSWNFPCSEYRVKPDPPYIYGIQLADGTLSQSTWHRIENAESALTLSAPSGSCVVKLVLAPDEEQPF